MFIFDWEKLIESRSSPICKLVKCKQWWLYPVFLWILNWHFFKIVFWIVYKVCLPFRILEYNKSLGLINLFLPKILSTFMLRKQTQFLSVIICECLVIWRENWKFTKESRNAHFNLTRKFTFRSKCLDFFKNSVFLIPKNWWWSLNDRVRYLPHIVIWRENSRSDRYVNN